KQKYLHSALAPIRVCHAKLAKAAEEFINLHSALAPIRVCHRCTTCFPHYSFAFSAPRFLRNSLSCSFWLGICVTAIPAPSQALVIACASCPKSIVETKESAKASAVGTLRRTTPRRFASRATAAASCCDQVR